MLKNSVRYFKRFMRALYGRDLTIHRQCKVRHSFFGADNAGWDVAIGLLNSASLVYSFGVGDSIQFELELIRRFGLTIHAFDPSPRSIQYVNSQQLPDRFHFHDFGIADSDGMIELFPPQESKHVSFSAVRKPVSTDQPVKVPVYRLTSIMKRLNHPRIELLKMDVEGLEYEIVDNILSEDVRIPQILIEFHHLWPEIGLGKTKAALAKFNGAGYRVFAVSPSGAEYSLIRLET